MMARNGYGQGYGLENQGGNAIRFYWGAYNATNAVRTAQWDTGLSAPENEWTFVALVVEGTNASVYVGSKTSFTSTNSADIGGIPDHENLGYYMTLVNSTTLGESNLRLGVGRNPIPWADDGNGAPWTSTGGTWSDIGVFYQVLTPAQIKGIRHPHPLPRQRADAAGPDGWPGADVDRQHALGVAADPGWQAGGAGCDLGAAGAATARRAGDCQRAAGLRSRSLVRAGGAGGHAAADH